MRKSANSLQALRKAKGITLQALSEKTGISKSHINNFENGNRGMDNQALKKIAEILQTTIEEISSAPIAVREDHPQYVIKGSGGMMTRRSLEELIVELSDLLGADQSEVRKKIAEMINGRKKETGS